MEDVHVEGAERIADAVAKYDVDRFVHVSSYNADANSTSEFYRTKVISQLQISLDYVDESSRPEENPLSVPSFPKQLLSGRPQCLDSKTVFSTSLLV